MGPRRPSPALASARRAEEQDREERGAPDLKFNSRSISRRRHLSGECVKLRAAAAWLALGRGVCTVRPLSPPCLACPWICLTHFFFLFLGLAGRMAIAHRTHGRGFAWCRMTVDNSALAFGPAAPLATAVTPVERTGRRWGRGRVHFPILQACVETQVNVEAP